MRVDLWDKDAEFRGTVCPVFHSRSGEIAVGGRLSGLQRARAVSDVAVVTSWKQTFDFRWATDPG